MIAVTLDTHTSPPSVDIAVSGLPVGTASLSVLRVVSADILSAASVRGASSALVGTTADVTDWDAPTGVPVTYRVTALSGDGTVLESAEATSDVIPDPGGSLGWLSDPLDVDSPLTVTMMMGTDAQRNYDMPVSLSYPVGDGLGRAVYGTRRQPTYQLVLRVEGLTAASTLRELLTRNASMLWRPPSHLGLPPVIYGVAQPQELPQGPRPVGDTPVFYWSADLTATRGPGWDILRGGWTYGDILALGLTYRQLFTAWGLPADSFGSYRDLLRGP